MTAFQETDVDLFAAANADFDFGAAVDRVLSAFEQDGLLAEPGRPP